MSLRSAILLVLLPAGQIGAQAAQRDSSLADSSALSIMAHVTPRGDPSRFLDIMRQAHRTVPQPKLDALADSLVARAIADSHSQSSVEVKGSLVVLPSDLLAMAGNRGTRKGTPYRGAIERLIRIHQQATDDAVRTAALSAMPGVVGRERGLAYLKTVATSNDPTSWYAINILTIDASGGSWSGPRPTSAESEQSDAILRALYSSGQVRNARAKRFLDQWALRKAY